MARRSPHPLQGYHWAYGVRTGSHSTVTWDGESFRGETGAACIKPGTLGALRDAGMPEAAYGPLLLLCGWAKGSKAPLYVVTTMTAADAACRV